ncbi:MAG: MobB mobilization protein [Synergistaceae bacterium]|nr:MobB mobilization protein [Synergistaceae bacterium]MBR0234281.1 MobB mobilization protein [Synergistaceae bacterium]MBR0316126.1 MobB mobilization protein [Synergistaceae bacterium]
MRVENLEARIDFRVTREERQEIQEQAEASGLSVSEYVRRRALARRVDSVTDVKMISELRRQGGLLKKIYTESGEMYSKETSAALGRINRFIELLERKVLNDSENSIAPKWK